MKKLTLLLVLVVFAASCSDDIESNTPSIQGQLNNNFFRSNVSSALINDDLSVTLTGETGGDEITLKASKFEIGSYVLGLGSESEANYNFDASKSYATGTTGDGLIEITRIRGPYLSGEFYFNAINGDTINVSKGSFFDVPVTNYEEYLCISARVGVEIAEAAYNQVTIEDDNFVEICTAYKTALEAKKSACGDPDGDIATILQGVDCTPVEENLFTAEVNTQQYEYVELTAEELADTIKISAFETDMNELTIFIPNDIVVGNFDAAELGNTDDWVFEATLGEITTIVSSSVVLEITTHDTTEDRIAGEFAFTCEDSQDTSITYEVSGTFDVAY
ncbi:DUF6252 family protein [Mesonia aestuariivivens]|uniref:DUF5689 domain-containing protein n=1 Tax=Mesonia aestuariivivens TaxID=2796128 RepID=A0ABS6VY28_9FLAO|nr:DUF6252 family protein [Mesonia aestuariivivens]MBW2960498.1 hypothetical protein [Mesonia aestuariivivens]